jgi:hypothetical protein
MRPFARIKEVTPSSQAKKSNFEVRTKICVTVGSAFETMAGDKDTGGIEGPMKCPSGSAL